LSTASRDQPLGRSIDRRASIDYLLPAGTVLYHATAEAELAAFQPVVEAMGERALFTPRYRIMDGAARGW